MKKYMVFTLFTVCLLLAVPSSGTNTSTIPPPIVPCGTILYLGGSGPNNYTKIQDAINASTTGDTIYIRPDDMATQLLGPAPHTSIHHIRKA